MGVKGIYYYRVFEKIVVSELFIQINIKKKQTRKKYSRPLFSTVITYIKHMKNK